MLIINFRLILISCLAAAIAKTSASTGDVSVLTLQKDDWLADSVIRLSKNLDYLGYTHQELYYTQSDKSYPEWMVGNIERVARSTNANYLFIINRASAVFTKEPSYIIEQLRKKEKIIIIADQAPPMNCSDDKEVCRLSKENRVPLVIAGRKDQILNLCNQVKQDSYSESVWGSAELKDQITNNDYDDDIVTFVNESLTDANVSSKSGDLKYLGAGAVLLATDQRTKTILNQMSNYLPQTTDCYVCMLPLQDSIDQENTAKLTIALFIERATPFIEQFFAKVLELKHSKTQTTLLIHNRLDYHNASVEAFLVDAATQFNSIKYLASYDDMTENEARMDAIKYCHENGMDYCLFVSSTALLDNPDTISSLIQLNRSVVAPVLARQYSYWSNFWGSVLENGYYERSFDYMSIVNGSLRGVWNVPHISDCYMMNKTAIERLHNTRFIGDFDLSFPAALRVKDMFMYVSNVNYYGMLINHENYNTSLPRPDLYQLFDNYNQWVDKYIHPDFWAFLNDTRVAQEPATDIFWFPMLSDDFCDDLIATVVDSDMWSGGKHSDTRLPGGYENVPTDDIHMSQIGFADTWNIILRNFVMPMQRKLFPGYISDPPRAPLSFVVRYHPDRQNRLKPHHDASTYTINIALNHPGIDYEGGGVRFIRYNTDIKDLRKGWMLMHPGRLTHLHEGLPTTNGTRFIFVSFVDP